MRGEASGPGASGEPPGLGERDGEPAGQAPETAVPDAGPEGAGTRPLRIGSRTVFEGWSELTGRIRVVDYRQERRLVCSGDILSIYPLDGDWSRVEGEYWWHALVMSRLPPRPRALLVGLGGGTQAHLLARMARPRELVVIERDPVIVQVACDWFGLRALPGLEFLCGEAGPVVRWLTGVGRRFDFVMEDAAYAAPSEEGLALAEALVPLVARGGRLVINRHRRGDGREVAARLRPRFRDLRVRRVRRDGENVLIACTAPRRAS